MKVENITLCNLEGAIKASKYPMTTDTNKCTSEITKTVKKLGNALRGTAHDNFLNGIVVIFDLTCSNKMWIEFERYHFADIISSQSTMHRIAKLDLDKQFNEYVTDNTKEEIKRLVHIYNNTEDSKDYLTLLYNIPSGIELTAQIVTNYGQLKTMHNQRANHRLPEWRRFCEWIESLPYFKELCFGDDYE